jgi:glycosyltransferase involved in cell wall biosynthesis
MTQRQIRVLMIGPSLDILGGQARQAVRLLGHFRTEPSVDVQFLAVNPRLPGPLRYLQRIKYVRTLVTTLAFWATLLLRVPRFEILHVFSASYYSYLLCAAPPIVLGKLFKKKVLLNYRSGEAEDHLANWRLTALPTIRLADMVVVPSGYLVDVFQSFGVSARPVFNIVELDRFAFRQRSPLGTRFLTSRLLEPLYNVGCVLRAFQLIQQRFPDAQLTVAGDGWMRRELEDLARQLNLRNTEFVGRVPFERMPALYDGADIYLTATNLDNMPGSIIECFATGLPVVTTDAGGVPYIVRHEKNGLIVPKNDHRAMADAAMRLLADEELVRQITAQAHQDCEQYRWEAVRTAWLGLYMELAGDHAASHAHLPGAQRADQDI